LQVKKSSKQIDLKEMVRWQTQKDDIQERGATGGAPMTT